MLLGCDSVIFSWLSCYFQCWKLTKCIEKDLFSLFYSFQVRFTMNRRQQSRFVLKMIKSKLQKFSPAGGLIHRLVYNWVIKFGMNCPGHYNISTELNELGYEENSIYWVLVIPNNIHISTRNPWVSWVENVSTHSSTTFFIKHVSILCIQFTYSFPTLQYGTLYLKIYDERIFWALNYFNSIIGIHREIHTTNWMNWNICYSIVHCISPTCIYIIDLQWTLLMWLKLIVILPLLQPSLMIICINGIVMIIIIDCLIKCHNFIYKYAYIIIRRYVLL